MALIEFENDDKYFIKFFLLDATLNLNRWGVTEKALRTHLNSFIDKPFILTPDFGHPTAANGDDLLRQQEQYRVGNIIQVGIENRSGKAWGLAEITDENAKEILRRGDVSFVSPSIVFDNINEEYTDGKSIITEFTAAHVAGVKEPAYGIDKAEIKGKCAGGSKTCLSQLSRVQASRSKCGRFTTIKVGKKEIIIAANDCVEKCIKKKSESGKDIDEQALAICYSECGESNKIEQENSEPTETEMANISDESLDNITKIDLLKAEDYDENKHERDPDGKFTSSPKSKDDKQQTPVTEKETRNFYENYEKDHGEPPYPEQIAKEFGIPENEARNISKELYDESGYQMPTPEEYDEFIKEQKEMDSKNSSHKAKKISIDKDMKRKLYATEEKKDSDEKDKEEAENEEKEESKSKRADDEEKEYEREMSKADDEEKEDAEDDDEDDKKDASLRGQVRSLKSELKALKAKVKSAEIDPLIESILDAKSRLGKIDERVEYAKLSKLDISTLHDLAENYKGIVEAKVSPRFTVRQASVDSSLSGDSIFKKISEGYD